MTAIPRVDLEFTGWRFWKLGIELDVFEIETFLTFGLGPLVLVFWWGA
jgi:hypothetical protein